MLNKARTRHKSRYFLIIFTFLSTISCTNTFIINNNMQDLLNLESEILTDIKDYDEAIVIVIEDQKLYYLKKGTVISTYTISSSKYGIGSKENSYKTPLGRHKVSEKIGEDLPLGAIFKARQWSGSLANIIKEPLDTDLDLVTSRILWLEGQELGKNRGPGVDSKKRFIYIHGTAEEGLIGIPASDGCIRMYNSDVIELFNKTKIGTEVWIYK